MANKEGDCQIYAVLPVTLDCLASQAFILCLSMRKVNLSVNILNIENNLDPLNSSPMITII